MSGQRSSSPRQRVVVIADGQRRSQRDQLAGEVPLAIRLVAGSEQRSLAVTMRTPGADVELAAGFLFAEGIVATREEIAQIRYCVDDAETQDYNQLTVHLNRSELPDVGGSERYGTITSACGLCGKTSLEALDRRITPLVGAQPLVSPELLYRLPERLRAEQALFTATGGLHAAGLFTATGELLALREDVGRHNALDKLIGWALLNGRLPLHDAILLVSGRASFELVQKAALAGIAIFCAVSAPSSLAVQAAQRFNISLIGFLRERRLTVYSGIERLADA